MSIARALERRLERLVEGLSASLFGGTMHAVDIANRVVRHADLSSVDTVAGPAIPNVYHVYANPSDLQSTEGIADLEAELASTLVTTAIDRGWRLDGPVEIVIEPGEGVKTGSVTCQSDTKPGPLRPWAQLIDLGGGSLLSVAPNRALIGRADECDGLVDDPSVSRHHAVLFRESGKTWLADLESSNGSGVNGDPVGQKPSEVHAGDSLSFGPTTFSLRLL